MDHRPFNVLFLCTGNSGRSILAESLLRHAGHGRFESFSAGSFPKGVVDDRALDLLRQVNLPIEGLRSKSWDEFALPGAPIMDLVITVCDDAAGETCPVWPGHPVVAHWSVQDPASLDNEAAQMSAFHTVLRELENRIVLLTQLPVATLDRMALKSQVDGLVQRP